MCAHMHPCSELEADAVRRTGGADPGLFMIRNVLLLLPVHCLYGCKRGNPQIYPCAIKRGIWHAVRAGVIVTCGFGKLCKCAVVSQTLTFQLVVSCMITMLIRLMCAFAALLK